MTLALLAIAAALGIYGAVVWLTRAGGPCDALAFWDEGQDRK